MFVVHCFDNLLLEVYAVWENLKCMVCFAIVFDWQPDCHTGVVTRRSCRGILREFLELHDLLYFHFCRTLNAAFGAEIYAYVDTKAPL